jgi:hypothetical protein
MILIDNTNFLKKHKSRFAIKHIRNNKTFLIFVNFFRSPHPIFAISMIINLINFKTIRNIQLICNLFFKEVLRNGRFPIFVICKTVYVIDIEVRVVEDFGIAGILAFVDS